MEYSEFHLSTIVKVGAGFGFFNFDFHPDIITSTLGITPDEIRIKDEIRTHPNEKEFKTPFNSWGLSSNSDSKDINVHLRVLLQRLEGLEAKFKPEFGQPCFDILYKSNYLYVGSGPWFEVDVIAGIARLKAEMVFDIYQVDEEVARDPNSQFERLTREQAKDMFKK
jgi:hypothetical protein